MRPIRPVCLLTVLLTLGPAPAAAQQDNTVEDFREIASKIVTESKIFPLMRSVSDGVTSSEPRVDLLASNDGTVAKARFGYLLKYYLGLDATFSAPVAAGTGRLLTQQGLGGGVAAEGALRVVLHRSQRSAPVSTGFMSGSESLMGMKNLPETMRGQKLMETFSFDQLVGAAIESARQVRTAGGPEAAMKTTPSATPPFQPSSTVLAGPELAARAQELTGDRGQAAFAHAFRLLANDLEAWQVDRAVVMSIGMKAGRPEFTLVDGGSFQSVTRDSRTREFSLGLIQSMSKDKLTRGFYAGITITEGTIYSGTQRQTCLPVGDAGGVQCRNALLAEPRRTDVELYQGEFRYYFDALKFAVGFRPGYNRDGAEHEKWSIEVPIMFLQNSKDLQSALADDKAGLTGGLTVGIRDSPNGKQFTAVFSVGSLFKLPGVPQ